LTGAGTALPNRAGQGGVDQLPVVPVQAGGQSGVDGFGGGDQRRRSHVRPGAQPANEAGQPLRVAHGDLPHQVGVAVVAAGGVLVEGVLADEVGHRQQEQLAFGVAGVRGGTFVGAGGGDLFGAQRAVAVEPSPVDDVELRHGWAFASRVRGGARTGPGEVNREEVGRADECSAS